tara:strand:+ start:573 stop:959 length:387 start_codon:yes stop_codon:yes gene_type:complete
MAHYALLNENNIVIQVITGKNEGEKRDGVTVNWEQWYKDFHGVADCKRTSYNTNANVHANDGTPFRGNYATEGYLYDTSNDVFLSPKPYANWIIDTNTWSWKAPVDMPDDGKEYDWDETTTSWVDYPS